ncbi:MAG: PD-(D/E)XK nuclease family protein [Acetobacteraceae bacterium]|nr:PD-(D/E)XK nuclease family protein [Acetobacteraceae bacterium]
MEERNRRANRPPFAILSEVKGAWDFARPGGTFTLIGRADRIERDEDGHLAILDYKTGVPPGPRDVEVGLAPQLPLEACMAEEGAFGPELRGVTEELTYWHLTGGYVPGEVCSLFAGDPKRIAECIATSRARFLALIDSFDDPGRCYLSQPHPARAPRFPHYAQLARVAEWTAAGEDA